MIAMAAHSPRIQRGFTLIEILVTLVLVSVGLLGVAALQLTSLRSNQESYVRSQASVLSADILDRMRANPIPARQDRYNVDWNGTGADATTRAGRDLADWQALINRTLPGTDNEAAGRVQVVTVGNRSVVTIQIRWNERPDTSVGAPAAGDVVREFRTRSEI